MFKAVEVTPEAKHLVLMHKERKEILSSWIGEIVSSFAPMEPLTLDLCCGDSLFAYFISSTRYVGVDSSLACIKRNNKKWPNHTWIKGSIKEAMPILVQPKWELMLAFGCDDNKESGQLPSLLPAFAQLSSMSMAQRSWVVVEIPVNCRSRTYESAEEILSASGFSLMDLQRYSVSSGVRQWSEREYMVFFRWPQWSIRE